MRSRPASFSPSVSEISVTHGADQRAVALGALDGDHALAAPAVPRILADRRALAEAVLRRGKHALRLILRREHAHHPLAFGEPHAAHARRLAAHRPHVGLLE